MRPKCHHTYSLFVSVSCPCTHTAASQRQASRVCQYVRLIPFDPSQTGLESQIPTSHRRSRYDLQPSFGEPGSPSGSTDKFGAPFRKALDNSTSSVDEVTGGFDLFLLFPQLHAGTSLPFRDPADRNPPSIPKAKVIRRNSNNCITFSGSFSFDGTQITVFAYHCWNATVKVLWHCFILT